MGWEYMLGKKMKTERMGGKNEKEGERGKGKKKKKTA